MTCWFNKSWWIVQFHLQMEPTGTLGTSLRAKNCLWQYKPYFNWTFFNRSSNRQVALTRVLRVDLCLVCVYTSWQVSSSIENIDALRTGCAAQLHCFQQVVYRLLVFFPFLKRGREIWEKRGGVVRNPPPSRVLGVTLFYVFSSKTRSNTPR